MATKSVGVKTIPEAAGTITGKDTVCQGHDNYVYSVPAITGATLYVWTLPTGVTATAGQTTNQITLSIGNAAVSGNLNVKGQNDCGDGTGAVKFIQVNNCTGINSNKLESAIQIFPNPVSEELTLNITGNERQLNLTIIDRTGRVQYTETLSDLPANYTRKLDMSKYAKGVYFVRLSHNDRVYSEKIVVQ